MRPQPQPQPPKAPSQGSKRAYCTPRMECYGQVHDLVQRFGGGPLSDAGNNMMAAMTPPS